MYAMTEYIVGEVNSQIAQDQSLPYRLWSKTSAFPIFRLGSGHTK